MLRIVRDLLAVLEAQNLMPPKRPLPFNTTRPGRNSGEPLDNRSKVIKELLETERSYITSLEELQV